MFNPKYPPRNRRATELPVLRIEIEHADGTEVFDPNGMIGFLLTRKNDMLAWRPVPGRVSDISGKPALLYRAADYEVALTPEEMLRYTAYDLKPDEFFAIRERLGDHFEIHDDMYDEETGEALQPVFSR